MKRISGRLSIVAACTIMVSGCINLKEVNSYSTAALTGVKKYGELSYSFTVHCLDKCETDAIRRTEIKRNLDCDCSMYQTADSATMQLYTGLKRYFSGLAELSDNELTSYRYDALETALKEGEFGKVKIEKMHVDAYGSLSRLLIRAATDSYRKKKIRKYIGEANQPVQVLTEKLIFILQENLRGELNFRKERTYSHYQELNRSSTTEAERSKATVDYYRELAGIKQKIAETGAYVAVLKQIAAGHQQLYDNRNKLTAKKVKKLLKSYAADVQDVVMAFNTLKTNNDGKANR